MTIKRMLVLCDIDGVMADCEHRLKYLDDKDYDKFYGACMADDSPIKAGIELVKSITKGGERESAFCLTTGEHCEWEAELYFLTGRPEKTRSLTKLWLKSEIQVRVDDAHLLMRSDGDYRPSPQVKVEQARHIFNGEDGIVGCIDGVFGALAKALKKKLGEDEEVTVYFIDDDPSNVQAVCEAFPVINGLIFGIKRINRIEIEE